MIVKPVIGGGNNRIYFIDLAKGFCIILVVLTHIMNQAEIPDFEGKEMLKIFRMPLYFVLSGLFFKTYEGFDGFLKRKINKLLIPFLFFYYTISVGLTHLMWLHNPQSVEPGGVGLISLIGFIVHDKWPNNPIWFLWCLFLTNILFYVIVEHFIKRFIKNDKVQIIWLIIITFTIGALGYCMGESAFNLPAYLDTTCSVMPFFCIGYVLKKYTNVLYPNKYDRYSWMIIILCFVTTYMFAENIDYRRNVFNGLSILSVYGCGIAGTMGTLYLSKMIGHLPFISYLGRYSIMILVTHFPIMRILLKITDKLNWELSMQVIVVSFITLSSYIIMIPLMRRFFPYVTAQKDVIKIV